LTRWLGRTKDLATGDHGADGQAPEDMTAELKRLRRENDILKQERDILKRATVFFCQGGKSVRFKFIDQAKEAFPAERLCRVLGVSCGYFAWRSRPASRRQRQDMVLLAHARAAFAASNETYASPRMTHEVREAGLAIGRRRVARLMRENGLKARQKRRFKRTTDSEHASPVAANLLDQDFAATAPHQKWGVDISYCWTCEGGLYLAVMLDLFSRRIVGWAVD
ncbi:IS3 family transposase, partial [Kozakia baliensis]|uniref:IS3 family transposase n=1 Tax=Kozakia baliensis TaxID=153496 RepID=UPI00222F61B7